MHVRESLELAALVADWGPVFVDTPGVIPERALERYWTASKCRLDRWARTLKLLSHPAAGLPRLTLADVRGTIEGILAGEVLTRVWAAVLTAHDARRGQQTAEPIARSVLIGHVEARFRALNLLLRGPGVNSEMAVGLNRLRRRAERWTDLLVGRLVESFPVEAFALDPERAREFAAEFTARRRVVGGRLAWPMLLAALRAAFQQGLGPHNPTADLDADIAASIIGCFPPNVFHDTGLPRSVEWQRMLNAANDADGLIANLFAAENSPGHLPADSQPPFVRRPRPRSGR